MSDTVWAILFTATVCLCVERLVHSKEGRAMWGYCLGMNVSSMFVVILRIVA
jgi:hypothetical protein